MGIMIIFRARYKELCKTFYSGKLKRVGHPLCLCTENKLSLNETYDEYCV
jgi:hypothetical protein